MIFSHRSLARSGRLLEQEILELEKGADAQPSLPASSPPCFNHPSSHSAFSVASFSTLLIFATLCVCACESPPLA